jgi:hypothetical protein
MDIYKCPKFISLFTFGKKIEKSLWTKGCYQMADIYAVVTEIITGNMRAYMVTKYKYIIRVFQ